MSLVVLPDGRVGSFATVNDVGGNPLPDQFIPASMPTSGSGVDETTLIGALTETAPATDTASSGLNGRLQRIAQRISSMIALLPASIGSKTAATSLAVALATDEPLIGALTETAPATDTASSGLNGRLQRIAQRLTTWIGALVTNSGTVGVVNYLYDPVAGTAVSMTDPVQTFVSNSYANLAANATTTVKSGAGTLAGFSINTKGASANTMTIYDSLAGSGTKIGTFDTTSAVGMFALGAAVGTGITIVLATGTAADVTIYYR